jgi:hypothetical protein
MQKTTPLKNLPRRKATRSVVEEREGESGVEEREGEAGACAGGIARLALPLCAGNVSGDGAAVTKKTLTLKFLARLRVEPRGRGTRNGKGRDGKEQGKSGGEKHLEGGEHAGERRQVERAAAGAKRRGRSAEWAARKELVSLNPRPKT